MTTKAWIVLLSIIAMVALGVAAFLAPTMRAELRARADVTRSKDNMRSFVTLLLSSDGRRPPVGGKRLVLWPAVATGALPRTPKDVEAFFSPAERARPDPAAYGGLTEKTILDPSTDVRALTSYAGRRSGLAPDHERGGPVPLFADLSFRDRGFVLVAYSDRRVAEMTRDELGLGPDDPIVVGEASRSPLLALLSDE